MGLAPRFSTDRIEQPHRKESDVADQKPDDRKDDSIGETPSKPGKKRPSDWGVGNENSRSPSDAGSSPPIKSL
jgi:hypothetical protein